MNKKTSLVLIIGWLLIFSSIVAYCAYGMIDRGLTKPFEPFLTMLNCVLIGGAGGAMYCLRGIYRNYSKNKSLDNVWIPWYFLRPIVSLFCGGVAFLFLKAGLLLLEAEKPQDTSNLGFYAFALIAGMNVDNFIKKIEEIAETTWGIHKSRASDTDDTLADTDKKKTGN
ncbi:MAG TPA: hypothetical protein VK528_06750 [Flavobacterium sp.]|nr:hypothetical protein [Flavobacterium sp.]